MTITSPAEGATTTIELLPPDLTKIIALATDAMTSRNSQVMYRSCLGEFLRWYTEKRHTLLTRAVVQAYRTELLDKGISPAVVNVRLSAIRKLAEEARENGFLPPDIANSIIAVKGVGRKGVRTGTWLDKEQTRAILNQPGDNLRGLRDKAILAVLIGCGLRRDEAANLTVEHIRQVENRWAIVNIIGKGRRVRTIPMPAWAKTRIDEWIFGAGIARGRIFLGIAKNGTVGRPLSGWAIREIVKGYGAKIKVDKLAPNDLRRTYAHLAYAGQAPLEQIQLSLGHESIQTTEKYLGVKQNFKDAPCDRLELDL